MFLKNMLKWSLMKVFQSSQLIVNQSISCCSYSNFPTVSHLGLRDDATGKGCTFSVGPSKSESVPTDEAVKSPKLRAEIDTATACGSQRFWPPQLNFSWNFNHNKDITFVHTPYWFFFVLSGNQKETGSCNRAVSRDTAKHLTTALNWSLFSSLSHICWLCLSLTWLYCLPWPCVRCCRWFAIMRVG